MKRRIILSVVVALAVVTLFIFSTRAWLAAPVQTTGDCGCYKACMGGDSCAIKCPTGKAAHCNCADGTQQNPGRAYCYCG